MKIGLSVSRFSIIASATSSVAAFHFSTTASWRSSWVIRPIVVLVGDLADELVVLVEDRLLLAAARRRRSWRS